MNSILASQPAAPRSIRGIPKFFDGAEFIECTSHCLVEGDCIEPIYYWLVQQKS